MNIRKLFFVEIYMNWLQLLLGQIPEGIFFAWFMILSKGLKNHRMTFVLCITFEYIFLLHCFHNTLAFYVLFMVLVYLILKAFYKEKSQITDIFILIIAYFYVCITSVICYFICFSNVGFATLLNRLALFIPLLLFNYKLHSIQKLYKVQWNRGSPDAKIKSATFRSLNLVLFYIFFVLIHACIIFGYANFGLRR